MRAFIKTAVMSLLTSVLLTGCSTQTVIQASPVPSTTPSPDSRQTPAEKRVVISLVCLTGRSKLMTEDEMKTRLVGVLGDQKFSLTYAKATTFLKSDDWFFQIHQYQEPYFHNDSFDINQIKDPELRESLKTHKGWIAVDAVKWPEALEAEESYKTVGKILAELSEGNDCKAVYLPIIGQFLPYQDSLLAELRSDPLAAFEKELDRAK